MNRRVLPCLFAIAALLPIFAHGQAASPSTNRTQPRNSYDPGAALFEQKKQQPGSLSTALGKINPCNTDYGVAFDSAHIAIWEESFNNFLWWISLGSITLFGFACLYIYWLWHEQNVRLQISADIVSQLYNGHVASRQTAIEYLDKYNALMRRFNLRTVEQAAVQKAQAQEEQKQLQRTSNDISAVLTDTPETDRTAVVPSNMATPGGAKKRPGRPKSESSASGKTAVGFVEVSDDGTLGGDEAEVIERLKSRLHAQDEKISNLRTQLNRAHDRFVSGQPQQEGGR